MKGGQLTWRVAQQEDEQEGATQLEHCGGGSRQQDEDEQEAVDTVHTYAGCHMTTVARRTVVT